MFRIPTSRSFSNPRPAFGVVARSRRGMPGLRLLFFLLLLGANLHIPVAATEAASEAAVVPVSPPKELLPESPFLSPLPAAPKSNSAKDMEWERFLDQLESARKYRTEKNMEMARGTLIPLLESDAPPEIQQSALLELGLIAEHEREYSRAQQVYNQYLKHFSESAMAPEVLLRQGLLYREMGAPTLALAKFYSVGSSALKIKEGNLANYRRIVLQAQTEIANTYFLQGKYEEAIEFFNRLLKQDNADLFRARIQYKLVLCFERIGKLPELEGAAREYLKKFSDSPETPEVRFILASALKRAGRHRESLQEVSLLLMNQSSIAKTNYPLWAYWQQRAGNEIANQLYNEGDFLNALEVYKGLLPLNPQADWQLPVTYQMGLIYEKLNQPMQAYEQYQAIMKRSLELATNTTVTPGARTVLDMARWRSDQLAWQLRAEKTNAFFTVNARGNSGASKELPPSAGAAGVPTVPIKPQAPPEAFPVSKPKP